MVAIKPNQFSITAQIISTRKEEGLKEIYCLVLKPERIEKIKGPAEFLKLKEEKIEACIQEKLFRGLKLEKGMKISCLIRKSPGRFFILPDSVKIEE